MPIGVVPFKTHQQFSIALALDVDFLTSPEQVEVTEAVEDSDFARFFQRLFIADVVLALPLPKHRSSLEYITTWYPTAS